MPDVRISSPTFISEVQQTVRNTQLGKYSSVNFDGSGDYLTVPFNSIFNIPLDTAVTFECWVYTTSSSEFIMAGRNWSYGGTGPTWGFTLVSGITPRWAIAGTGSATYVLAQSTISGSLNSWNHYAFTRDSSNVVRIFVNGVVGVTRTDGQAMTNASGNVFIGAPTNLATYSNGYMSNMRYVSGSALYTANFTPPTAPLTAIANTSLLTCQDATFIDNSTNKFTITSFGDTKTSNFNPFPNILNFLNEGKNGSQLFSGVGGVVSTYSLVYTTTNAYASGTLAPNGDIHFIPFSAIRGQKISAAGVVSTYSLVYTTTNAYSGGVLASNGDINFIPRDAVRGQRISASGVVSTYSLVYTAAGSYAGGILAPNGDIHFVPLVANRGQKISAAGVVSTYSLVYTTSTGAYAGGALAPNGDIHFIPYDAPVGQKVSPGGAVSTYSLVYTASAAYNGGVLAPNGDIHFVPHSANIGQKISSAGVVSTYSLVYTTTTAYTGGVLAPNGDIHFIPRSAIVGQKISAAGVVSTYSLVYTTTNAYHGGVLAPNGDIHFVPFSANRGLEITLNTGVLFSKGLCSSQFLNKY
jgi:hypothetical protein